MSKYSRPRTGFSPAASRAALTASSVSSATAPGRPTARVDDVGEPLGGVEGETVAAVPGGDAELDDAAAGDDVEGVPFAARAEAADPVTLPDVGRRGSRQVAFGALHQVRIVDSAPFRLEERGSRSSSRALKAASAAAGSLPAQVAQIPLPRRTPPGRGEHSWPSAQMTR